MFKRIAVVNRGESAVRLIRAVRELNAEHDHDITTIALHTKTERRAMFVRQADDTVCLRETVDNPYIDHAELKRALIESRADAVWVGWGFVAEDPAFAELVADLGITFIGPSADAMRLLGDKVEAKLLAEKVSVPVAPWSGGPVGTRADARWHAQAIGYPLIIKARSGGGGRGIRKVWSKDELELALERTQGEALRSFGDPVVFLERLVTDARHVEVQVIADAQGNVWAPGVRDCSIQRKNQKVIEESSSPLLSKEQSDYLRTVSADLLRAAKYCGAATVEYLYQPEQKIFTFLEVNTRLQVEHPITEATTGLDLVKLQLQVASGDPLVGDCPSEYGHAVEARLNAEDADNGFAPAPGTVQLLKFPLGSGIRVDTGISAGDVIPPDYDSMVAKIIAWGLDRAEALARLRIALRETTVVLDGGTTTKSFLLDLLDREEIITASADTGWLDRSGVGEPTEPSKVADVALFAAGIEVYDSKEALERASFLASARGGRPRASHTIGRAVELAYQEQPYKLTVTQIGPHHYLVDSDYGPVEIGIDRLGEFEARLSIGDRRHQIVTVSGPTGYLVEVDGVSHQVSQDEAGVVRASAPAVVVALPVAVGDDVEAGATLVVLESMKMETAIHAPYAGTVREVLGTVNAQVDAGAPLLRVDQIAEEATKSHIPRVVFDLPNPVAGTDVLRDALARLRSLGAMMTGYDVSANRASTLLSEYDGLCEQLPVKDCRLVKAELALLTTFVDMCELSRNRPAPGEEHTEDGVHSPREHFHSYLHSLDADREGLPDAFRTKLAKALGHYEVTELKRTPEVEEAVYRVFLAQQRMDNQIPVVASLLERLLTEETAPEAYPHQLTDVLDRLIVATQVRYPVIGDVARNLRFRLFEEPHIRSTREKVYDSVRSSLDYLAEHHDASDYLEVMEELANTPETLVELLRERSHKSPALLEAMVRQYYSIKDLDDIDSFTDGQAAFVKGNYQLVGEQLRLVAAAATFDAIGTTLDAVNDLAGNRSGNVVIDLFLVRPNANSTADELSDELRKILEKSATRCWRRVTVAVIGPETRFLTFRPEQSYRSSKLAEEFTIRDMHPMTGQRLDLWRLKNFVGARLPARPGTYMYHLTARQNPEDERLFALAEVHHDDIQVDDRGAVLSAPSLERALVACVDGIRRERIRHRARRLDHNRVVLFISTTLDLDASSTAGLAKLFEPIAPSAGIEEITLITQGGETNVKRALRFTVHADSHIRAVITDPPTKPLQPLDEYTQKVIRSRARGTVYPYELIPQITGREGTFEEYDFDALGALVPVERPYGKNEAGIIVGLVTTPTERYPEGMQRVALFGDPTKALGTVAEAECARIVAAISLAEKIGVPVEWFALSSGATISMESGTENMDWVSRALRRIITFTQAGGEINVIVAGINVGAQPYWNAEATMLTHTKGILVMTPDSAMVLTGKQSLDYSGGVSAEDNFGIGGYDRVMGPNGQAQYWASNLTAACNILFAHYEYAYLAPGERFPRKAVTADPIERDVRSYPHVHPSSDFTTVGDIFSSETNPERKKSFDIRTVMRSIVDQDYGVLERWADMAGASTSVVFDAHLDGNPVSVIGIESRAIPRTGRFSADGPDQWTSGTLFPHSSKKTARAINAASGNRPVVVLANLSGFDGSPESLRNNQLEFGAEIGRAIVNFDGPIVFCVVSRYHGGAFVVFSGALNDNMEVLAVEGSFASVLGGAPAAAVVFTREVNARTKADSAVKELEAAHDATVDESEQARLAVELQKQKVAARSEKLGEVAKEFETIHNIERAREVGSVHQIVPAAELRPSIAAAVARGMARTSGSDNAPWKKSV